MTYEVFLTTLKGDTFSVQCISSDTIGDIKHKVQKLKGIPVNEQRTIFAGKGLEDGITLKDYNILRGNTIHLILRFRCFCWNIKLKVKTNTEKIKDGWEEDYKKNVLSLFGLELDRDSDSVIPGPRGRSVILKEIRDCYTRPHPNLVSLKCVNPPVDYTKWELILSGQNGSPYAGGMQNVFSCNFNSRFQTGHFKFGIKFDVNHPFSPIQISFLTRMFHPWFTRVGAIGSSCRDYKTLYPCGNVESDCGIISKHEWSAKVGRGGLVVALEDIIHSLVENMTDVVKLYLERKPKFPEGRPLKLLEEGKFEEFEETAKRWTYWFARHDNSPPFDRDEEERIKALCCGGCEAYTIDTFMVKLTESESLIIPKFFLF